VSSLATAPRGATSEPAGGTPVSRAARLGVTGDAILAGALAACLAAIVFVATGGTDLAPNTWIEIALIVVGGLAAAAVVVLRPSGRASGVTALVLFAALAALTYASIAWSVQPANSWVEANRTLSYLAAFGTAMALARLAPSRWPAVVGGVTIVAAIVCGYALLTKVFPATLNAGDPLGRLRAPFDYWNATGLMAGLGLPGCLWAAARPEAGRALRTAVVPAITVLFTVLILSYSRGALIAAVVGLACWFVFVPFRLRATLVLALGVSGGAIATAWALKHHAITHDYATLAARTSAGHRFGVVLLVVLAAMTLIGFLIANAMDRVALSVRTRRRIGTALVVLVAMVPIAAVAAVAASRRGLPGEISHAWHTLTSPNSQQPGDNAGRLAQLGNSRPIYWSEGLKVGEHAVLKGVGAVGFDTARTRYTTTTLQVAHAHSYLIETFADLGVIGLAVTFALLGAWAVAVKRTLWPAAPPRETPERAGLLTLLAVVVIFGVSSLIDWTWFIPGVAVPALICAGWLAGRGPLTRAEAGEDGPVRGRGTRARPDAVTCAAIPDRPDAVPRPAIPDRTGPPGPTDAERAESGRSTPSDDRRRAGFRREAPKHPLVSSGTIAAAIGIGAAVLIAMWFVWQPLRSTDSFDAAIAAMERGDPQAALADARAAATIDPVSVDPLWEQSAIYGALGDQPAARAELLKATSLQPDNPLTWDQLGLFDLQNHQARLAVPELETAHRLDLGSAAISQQVAQARAALAA
jgi:O-Antigen ligase